MRIYVSGSSLELPIARALIDALRNRGHEIAHDWPSVIDAAGGRANPADVSDDQKDAWVSAELVAINTCDLYVMLAPAEPTLTGGAFVELGYAHACGKTIHVIGRWESIFNILAEDAHHNIGEFLEVLGRAR